MKPIKNFRFIPLICKMVTEISSETNQLRASLSVNYKNAPQHQIVNTQFLKRISRLCTAK